MLRSIFGLDWKKSRAHLLLLSEFCEPRSIDSFPQPTDWEAALKETLKKALSRFVDEGLLEQVGLSKLLDYKYNVSELKPMLKERNLPMSGRKAELIERLIASDPDGMQQVVYGLTLLQHTGQGRLISEEYLAQEKEKRARVEEQTLNALKERKFEEAFKLVSAFSAQQRVVTSECDSIFLDGKRDNHSSGIAILKWIFLARPKMLATLNDSQLESLRLAAGMMHLWGESRAGTWLPGNLETNLNIDNDTAAMMIMFFAHHQHDIAQYQAAGVKKVRILAAYNSCESCQKLAKKEYKIDEIPDLPYEKCTSEIGCRCTIITTDF